MMNKDKNLGVGHQCKLLMQGERVSGFLLMSDLPHASNDQVHYDNDHF